jgi:hypothetical protein
MTELTATVTTGNKEAWLANASPDDIGDILNGDVENRTGERLSVLLFEHEYTNPETAAYLTKLKHVVNLICQVPHSEQL